MRRRPEDLNAYEIAVRANAKANAGLVEVGWAACAMPPSPTPLPRSPSIPEARRRSAALAFAQWQHIAFATASDRAAAWREGMSAADRAIEIDRSRGFAHSMKGCCWPFPSIATTSTRLWPARGHSYELNPHSMPTVTALSFIEIVSGEPESAIEHLLEALRLSPRDPLRPDRAV